MLLLLFLLSVCVVVVAAAAAKQNNARIQTRLSLSLPVFSICVSSHFISFHSRDSEDVSMISKHSQCY